MSNSLHAFLQTRPGSKPPGTTMPTLQVVGNATTEDANKGTTQSEGKRRQGTRIVLPLVAGATNPELLQYKPSSGSVPAGLFVNVGRRTVDQIVPAGGTVDAAALHASVTALIATLTADLP